MASHSSPFLNISASLRTKSNSQKSPKVPFRSANPLRTPDVFHSVQPESIDGGPSTSLHKLMAECVSPLRGRTMKEYDQQIDDLKSENFNLKLRIFLLEQRLQNKFSDSSDDVHKLNFELQVQVESLKKELANKKELLIQASNAIDSLESTHKVEIKDLQHQFSEQRKALEEQLHQLEHATNKFYQDSNTHFTNCNDSNRDDYYQQAFLPLAVEVSQVKSETENDAKLKDLQRIIEEHQSKIIAMDKELAEKEKFIQDEEVINLKRNKLIQGLVTAIKTKEKELARLQEQYQQKDLELKLVKEELNKYRKNSQSQSEEQLKSECLQQDSTEHLDQKQTLLSEAETENEKFHTALQEVLKQREEITESLHSDCTKENERLGSVLQENLKEKNDILERIHLELQQQLRHKEEMINKMKQAMQNRDSVLKDCFQVLGLWDSCELPDFENTSVTDALRLKLKENKNDTQIALEEKIKTLKEKDNEIVQLQDTVLELDSVHEQMKVDLKQAQDLNTKFQEELIQRDCRIQELLGLLKNLREETNGVKTRNSQVISEKDDMIRRLQKSFVESEKEFQEAQSDIKENAESLSSTASSLQKCISEKDKLIEELIIDKNRGLLENERSVQNLTNSLRDKDNVLKEVHERLTQEQNSRFAERDQLHKEIEKKTADIKNLENQIIRNEEQHQNMLMKLHSALEEKDKTIQSLIDTSTRNERDFQSFLTRSPGSNSSFTSEAETQYLKKEIDFLNKELTAKEDHFNSIRRDIMSLLKNATCNASATPSQAENSLYEAETSLEECFKLLEEKFLASCKQNQESLVQLNAINYKICQLRHLLDNYNGKENFGGAGDSASFEKNDIEKNITCLSTEVKLIYNLNEMLHRQLKLNNEARSKGNTNFDPQLIIDMALQIEMLKAKLEGPEEDKNFEANAVRNIKRSKVRNPATIATGQNFVFSNGDFIGHADTSTAHLLQDANNEIQILREKLSSTENTVHLLGSKVKHYRKLLNDFNHASITPSASPHDQKDTPRFPIPPCQIDSEFSKDASVMTKSLISRRSISAEDVCHSAKSAIVIPDDNQALSAEDVLTTVSASRSEPGILLDLQNSRNTHAAYSPSPTSEMSLVLNFQKVALQQNIFQLRSEQLSAYSGTPCSTESVNEFGQTDDILELKEQILWLKLHHEQYCHQLKENLKQKRLVFGTDPEHKSNDSRILVDAGCQTNNGFENDDRASLLFSPLECQWLQQQNSILQMKLDTLLLEIPEGQHSSFIHLQQQEILSLRNHLCDSHNACELLRIRLEELADFLEQLLQFDDNGLLDLSRFTPQKIASLQQHIAHSRELSINLSQSLLIDGDMSVISNCIDSTLLQDQEHSVLIDNDTPTNFNQSLLSNRREHIMNHQKYRDVLPRSAENIPRMKALEKHSEQSRGSNFLGANLMAKSNTILGHWQNCNNGNGNEKQAQSSYDDLVLLLGTSNNFVCDQPSENQMAISEAHSHLLSPKQNDVRNLAPDQEQAIIAEYVRECSVQRSNANLNQMLGNKDQAVAINPKTDTGAILPNDDVLSRRLKLVISPTDSESWSEPDRDVSQQRMGLEPEFSPPGDRPQVGRSPKSTRFRQSRSGSTNTECSTENLILGRRPRNDPWELWRLQMRLQNVEEVNTSLRSELQIYQSLLRGIPPITKMLEAKEITMCIPEEGNKISSSLVQQIQRKDSRNELPKTGDILQEHLTEIRMLRLRLEESIQINDQLRERLEKKLASQPSSLHTDERIGEKSALDELENQNKMYLKEKMELENQMKTLKQQVSELIEKLQTKELNQRLHNNVSDRDDAGNQLKKANQRLKNSLMHVQTALNDKDHVCKELRESNVRMQKTLDAVDKLILEKDAQLTNAQSQHAQMMRENEEINGKHKEKVAWLSQIVDEAKRNAEENLRMANEMNATEISQLQDAHQKALDSLTNLLREKERHLTELEQKIVAEFERELSSKEENLKELQKKFDEMSTAVIETEKQLEVEHGQNLSLQQKLSTCNKTIFDKDEKISSLQRQIQDLQSSLSELDSQRLSDQTKQLELQKAVEACQCDLMDRDNQVMVLRQVIDNMKEVIAEKKHLLEKQLEKAKNLEEKVELLSCSASEKEKHRREECAVRLQLQEHMKSVTDEAAASKNQVKLYQDSCENLQNDLAAQEKKYLDLQNKLDERGNVIRKLEEELHQSWEENERLQQQVISVQTMLHETNNLNKSMKTELQVYEHLHSSFVSSSSGHKDGRSLNPNLEVLLDEIRNLRTQLELSIQTSSALRIQLEHQFTSSSNDTCTKENHLGDSELSKDPTKASSNSIESGQFSDIDSIPIQRAAKEYHLDTQSFEHILKGHDKENVEGNRTSPEANETGKKQPINKKRPSNLQIPKRDGALTKGNCSAAEAADMHSVYSSPDLGIESDPSQFSCLEQRMSLITDEHVWEIRSKQMKDLKFPKKGRIQYNANSSYPSNEMHVESDRRLLYAIGRLDDYELLKKEVEEMVAILKGVQIRINDRLWMSSTNTPVKDIDCITWKDALSSANTLEICLGKSLQILGYFWTAMLPSEKGINKDETKNLIEENQVLRRKLRHQKKSLSEALQKLAASNRLKDGMEKAIMKQLSKTHDVLKKAKGNLEDQTKSKSEKV